MTRFTNQNLQEKIQSSSAFSLLIPSYQAALKQLSNSKELAQKNALYKIMEFETENDLQTIYFAEQMLEHFVETHCAPANKNQTIEEFRHKAAQLLQTFLFFDAEQKHKYLATLPRLSYSQILDLIELMRQGHRTQHQYLQTFVEKDPHEAVKFQVLVSTLQNKK